MSEIAGDRLMLGRVRLHAPFTSDPHRWRWRVADALDRVSITVAGLPPRSILVVRHLSEPCPGALFADNSWRGARQWSSKAQAQLATCWRQAARPASGLVSERVEAVWFADLAELLACLSWDVVQGQATRRWWWQTWLRRYAPSETLFRLWQVEPRWMPPALVLLIKLHGEAAARSVVMALELRQAAVLCDLIAAAYDLPAASPGVVRQMLAPALPAPYRTLVGELPPEPAALLVLNLTIGMIPSVVQAYRRRMRQPGGDGVPPVERSTGHELARSVPPESARVGPQGEFTPPEHSLNAEGIAPVEESPSTPRARRVAPARADEDALAQDESSRRTVPGGMDEKSPPSDDAFPREKPGDEAETTAQRAGIWQPGGEPDLLPAPEHGDTGETSPDSLISEAEREGVHTAFGGVWYLVNVLVALEWLAYDGFDDLNAWHKLLVLAQGLLRDEIATDPLWSLLSDLAQDPLPEALAGEWEREALPAVWAFLAERMESPHSFVEGLREPARLYVTRTHIDVVFRLEQIRLEIRMAGLDQDPGWVPELAHAIALHFD